ncbi:hypothetical protein Goklo_024172, partial [Gossypium klotzschianum]|nr:hypothetical protein [Gossypium klotzschianum]
MVKALKEETMATTMTLSIIIEELEGKLALYRAALGKGVSSAALSNEDVPELKEFVGTRSVCDVDNFLWRMENYFRAKGSEKDQMKDVVDGNGNDDSGGNRKPRVGKKKPKRKRDKLKCFFYDGPYMLKKCLKKFALKEKLIGKALVTGLSARGVEVREAESKEPKKLGLSKGKIEAKRAKKRKKKRVKCFLCRGPYELQNCPKQAVVKGKATSELGESSEGLPPKEEVGLSSDLEEKVVMKILKLGPMRLNFSEASKLTESLTRLPPMGEVGGALNFKGKEVMQ